MITKTSFCGRIRPGSPKPGEQVQFLPEAPIARRRWLVYVSGMSTAHARVMNDFFVASLLKNPEITSNLATEYAQTLVIKSKLNIFNLSVICATKGEIVTLKISGKLNGEIKSGTAEWTTMQILSAEKPLTQLIKNLFDDVFEVPSEGTSVS